MPDNYSSPGVSVSEIDLTTAIPLLSSSIGAHVGQFNWGPIEEIVTINNETQLVDKFGKPDPISANSISFFVCANFLAYSNNLKVIRTNATGIRNASNNASSLLIKNEIDYLNYSNGAFTYSGGSANTFGPFVARYAGALGNSLKYVVWDNASASISTEYSSLFSSTPSTTTWVSDRGGSNDELHIVVIDEDGKFTGSKNIIVEKFEGLSRATDAKDTTGTSNYYKEVINRKSKYLRWVSEPTSSQLSGRGTGTIGGATNYSGNSTTTFSNSTSNLTISLVGGVDATSGTSDRTSAYALLNNSEEVDVGLIFAGDYDSTTIGTTLKNLVEARKDCMGFFSPSYSAVVNNYGNEVSSILNTNNRGSINSSYLFMDSGWKYQYDKYNDQYVWVPLNGDIAGLCAKTDSDRDPWFSPGGMNRGFIKNIVKLAFNPTKSQRDQLYVKQVNPVVTFSGEGTVLFGDKTLLTKPSAFDRINVRRLFITLEKAISKAARLSLFEFNDAFTRAQFVSLVEPYLRDVQGRRGITDFRVVCDDTNNTAEVIDKNQFVGDIYIKPSRSINFIQLNFVAVRSGVNFDEIVGKF